MIPDWATEVVERGATWLDLYRPAWQEYATLGFDREHFVYSLGIESRGEAWLAQHGFLLSGVMYAPEDWHDLSEAWVQVLRKRQGRPYLYIPFDDGSRDL